MCLNPHFLLGKKIFYKGFEKTILYWNTSYEEYKRGYVNISKLPHIPSKLLNQLVKYGLVSTFVNKSCPEIRVIQDVIFDVRFEIPCRKCLACTRSRAKEWALRCHCESLNFKDNYFVTLTYNDANVPKNFYKVYDKEAECFHSRCVYTLCKEHTFAFMKSLRQNFSRKYNHDNIRFFMCGEYGTSTSRPHYHYILFNLPLNDLEFLKLSKNGFPIYRSKFLEKSWNKGFVTVQKYSIETARYTAQYCCKKLDKRSAKLECREMEFINMSRRPGIGTSYFLKHINDIYNVRDGFVNDNFIFNTEKKGKIVIEKYSFPRSVLRNFKPVTDSKRLIDTEPGSLYCLLNNDGDLIFDVLTYITNLKSSYCENAIRVKMSDYGFDYENDRYSEKYLEFLDILKNEYLKSFVVCRNSC